MNREEVEEVVYSFVTLHSLSDNEEDRVYLQKNQYQGHEQYGLFVRKNRITKTLVPNPDTMSEYVLAIVRLSKEGRVFAIIDTLFSLTHNLSILDKYENKVKFTSALYDSNQETYFLMEDKDQLKQFLIDVKKIEDEKG